jgi:hypothetical protein
MDPPAECFRGFETASSLLVERHAGEDGLRELRAVDDGEQSGIEMRIRGTRERQGRTRLAGAWNGRCVHFCHLLLALRVFV